MQLQKSNFKRQLVKSLFTKGMWDDIKFSNIQLVGTEKCRKALDEISSSKLNTNSEMRNYS